MFIKRISKYAVKVLSTGAARVFIQTKKHLETAGLSAGTRVSITYLKHKITIKPDVNGTQVIQDTTRGQLLELRNKSTYESIGDLEFVTVTIRKGIVIVTIHSNDKKRLAREESLVNDLRDGNPIRYSSFCSGTGMLAYHLKKGFEKAGVKTQIAFAMDACDVAMEVNVAGNPIWDNASEDAVAITDTFEGIDLEDLVHSHFVEVGLPCVNQSTLCAKDSRDLAHPIVGTLFVKLLACLHKINPAIVLIENTPAFVNSQTLSILKREMPGYRFEETMLNAHDYGELEARKRTCVLAISEGLPEINLTDLIAPKNVVRKPLSSILRPVADDSPLWRKMEHIKRKVSDPKLNFKNTLYTGVETLISTVTATYAAPKVGTPMIAHPTDPDLQRQLMVEEHGDLRDLPESMRQEIMSVESGDHPMVSSRGSKTKAHRLLGNGVSGKVWNAVGEFIGNYLNTLIPMRLSIAA
jgi:DNA (cytosine-5)-methyltransferase 1